ncbi:MAG TPA: dTDP-4-dehydrorhamnose 3,5-epimerase [Candidatus Cryosericum sp.]|nr:dTDP-4-dehydrorhamnose 3,5-epimerase [Candidatus Cryosericum sp.]
MGKFQFEETRIQGVFTITPTVFGDERGYFMETYHAEEFRAAGIEAVFVQDNQSKSRRGVLRGLHFQVLHPQAKLVRVISGEVFDVAVDIRKGSPTFGQWAGVTLSAENKKQFFLPRGMAHGFFVLSETAEFTYKCDEFYHPEDEGGIRWDDPDIGIEWPLNGVTPLLSEKDLKHAGFNEYFQTK